MSAPPMPLRLHGFPPSGPMVRALIPLLAERVRLAAPDLPGVGLSGIKPFLLPPGADAFRGDLPRADMRFLDTGQFVIETKAAEIVDATATGLRRRSTEESRRLAGDGRSRIGQIAGGGIDPGPCRTSDRETLRGF